MKKVILPLVITATIFISCDIDTEIREIEKEIEIPVNEPLWIKSAIVSFATESHSNIKPEPSSLGLR